MSFLFFEALGHALLLVCTLKMQSHCVGEDSDAVARDAGIGLLPKVLRADLAFFCPGGTSAISRCLSACCLYVTSLNFHNFRHGICARRLTECDLPMWPGAK